MFISWSLGIQRGEGKGLSFPLPRRIKKLRQKLQGSINLSGESLKTQGPVFLYWASPTKPALLQIPKLWPFLPGPFLSLTACTWD